MDAVYDLFRWLNTAYGINVSVAYDAYDRNRFVQGLTTTVWLSSVCIVLSILIGIVGAWLQGTKSRLVRLLVQGYIQFFRNTPPLIQLYFFFFALGGVLPKVQDAYGGQVPPVSNVTWAIISFAFFAGAFNVEIFRSGIEAVPRATVEAAESLGYSRFKAYIHVVLPLAFRVSLPSLGNNLVNLVKTTTLAYAIAVPELLYVCAQIWAEQLNVREMMNLLLVMYVAIIAVLVYILKRWERALKMPGFGQ